MYPIGVLALAMARKGFRVFPLREDNRDEEPAELKKPALAGDWKELATTDPVQIKKWFSARNYNFAVATLPDDDLVILDYDMKDGQNGARALATHELLDMPVSFRVRTASGGLHIYLRAPKGVKLPNSVSKISKHVDVRGNERGGYVVGPGSVIHGKAYVVEHDDPLAEIPDWTVKLASAGRRKLSSKQGEVLGELDTPASITRAIDFLENHAEVAAWGDGGDQTTFRVACRVKDLGVSEETALDLLLNHWNETKTDPSPWPPDMLATKVRNAYAHGSLPIGVSNPNAEFEPVELTRGSNPGIPAREHLYAVPFKDGAEGAIGYMGEPLIDELLDTGMLSVLYGKSGSGKTFNALDLSYHVAAGKPWHGSRVVKQGLVVYVAAEGGRGIFKRMAALRKHHEPSDSLPLVTVPCPINLLETGKHSDTRKLLELIRKVEADTGQKAELVVVDTLSRALAGGDENASTDMGAFVQHVDRLRAELKAHLMIVHHSGKDQAKGARGWSGIRAAVDTEIEIHEGKLTVMKQRDMDQIAPIHFALESVLIGHRADGKAVTSCVVQYQDAPELNVALTPLEEKWLKACAARAGLNVEKTGENTPEICRDALCKLLVLKDFEPDATKGKAVRAHFNNLTDKALLSNVGKSTWHLTQTGIDRFCPEPEDEEETEA